MGGAMVQLHGRAESSTDNAHDRAAADDLSLAQKPSLDVDLHHGQLNVTVQPQQVQQTKLKAGAVEC